MKSREPPLSAQSSSRQKMKEIAEEESRREEVSREERKRNESAERRIQMKDREVEQDGRTKDMLRKIVRACIQKRKFLLHGGLHKWARVV